MSTSPEFSVIVPALNEAGVIEACLRQFDGAANTQVIVVDGGSEDETPKIVQGGDAHLVESGAAGRSLQMNAGAEAADGPVLVFLHADCLLPASWQDDIRAVLQDEEAVGGRFRLGISEDTISFRLIAFFSTLRSRFLGITYGDQAIFVRRPAFREVGGFPSRSIFEDSEFCDALSRLGVFAMTRSKVVCSSRRWRAWGVWRTVYRMWKLRLMYARSLPDERLAAMYRDVR